MSTSISSRRRFGSGLAAIAGAAAVGCGGAGAVGAGKSQASRAGAPAEPAITPGEDLMREHGVLSRVLVAWAAIEEPLRRGADVDLDAVRDSVDLVQRFVEGYHARLEEELVFPRLEEAGRERELVGILRAQHDVGRAISAEVASLLRRPADAGARARVADRLADYRRMYVAHAAREDTVVFPALREIVGERYLELGETFERREHEIVGEGAFERAVAEAARIERALGVGDLARFTPS